METHQFQAAETGADVIIFCRGCGEVRPLELTQAVDARSEQAEIDHTDHICGCCSDSGGADCSEVCVP